jgi:hypothetical protein
MSAKRKPKEPPLALKRALLCDQEWCPVENLRKHIRDTLAERAAARGWKNQAETEQVITCKLCGKTKGWRAYADGREIPLRLFTTE